MMVLFFAVSFPRLYEGSFLDEDRQPLFCPKIEGDAPPPTSLHIRRALSFPSPPTDEDFILLQGARSPDTPVAAYRLACTSGFLAHFPLPADLDFDFFSSIVLLAFFFFLPFTPLAVDRKRLLFVRAAPPLFFRFAPRRYKESLRRWGVKSLFSPAIWNCGLDEASLLTFLPPSSPSGDI